LAERLTRQDPLDKPSIGRLSRQVRHFPITPEVSIRPDERGSHYIMSLTAADRPGLLYAIATVLSRHHLNLQTAKIATLGERVEDTFLINGSALSQTTKLLQIEQELLEVMVV
jgi:[protein-PII] uridylyltransferase